MRNQWGSTARALRLASLTLFSGAALAAGLPGREGILVTPEQEGLAGLGDTPEAPSSSESSQ